MNKMIKKLFLTFSVLTVLLFALEVAAVSSEVSKMRIKKITDIIRRYTNANEKLSDPYVRDAILDEVDKEFTLEPEENPNETSVKDIAKEVRGKVNKRFPDSIQGIKDKATKEADKKYKMAEKLDPVTVYGQKGKKSFKVSGIFYGFGVGGKSVRVGDNRPIAFFDLNPTSRAMFDKAYCEREKKNFIDERVRNYYRKKGSYSNTLFAEIREKITAENEALGYIYAWDKWRTPKNVSEYLIERIKQKQEADFALAQKNGEAGKDGEDGNKIGDDKNPANGGDEPPPDKVDPGTGTEVDPGVNSEKLRLAKLKKSIEERQFEIASSQYGIDADQGFNIAGKRVLWGMKQEEVNLIFKDELPAGAASEVETINYAEKGGPINQVKLYFINGLFYKVEIIYTIAGKDLMMTLWKGLNEKYGESAESQLMREAENARLERLAAIKLCPPNPKNPKKEGHDWDKKSGKCKKCKVAKADLHPPLPPLDQTFTWSGKITKGVLKVTLSSKRDAFTHFSLTKENTDIQATQQALIEAEKKRKMEEEKKKKLEEYRKSLE